MAMLGLKDTTTGVFAAYLAQFSAQEPRPAWLHELRQRAFARFSELGFPGPKHEAWRQSNLNAIAQAVFAPQPARAAAALVPALRNLDLPGVDWSAGATRLVFVNGQFAPGLSATGTAGVRAGSLAARFGDADPAFQAHFEHADEADQAFVQLNAAFVSDGAWVEIPAGSVVERPISIVHVTTAEAGAKGLNQPRTLILAGRESQASVIEAAVGFADEAYLCNAVTTIEVGDNAGLEYTRLEAESAQSWHISKLRSRQGRDSRFTAHSVALGCGWVRNNVHAIIDGEGAECTLTGLYVINGTQHVDNSTVLDHAKPLGTSREFYKGVLDGRASGAFNGRIIVRPDAQHTDAIQSNKNLLLSEAAATANSQPQLEIYADDVRCTHGATVGQLSAEALFYLRARGIGEQDARAMLVRAFAADVTGRIGLDPLRADIDRRLASMLPGGRVAEVVA